MIKDDLIKLVGSNGARCATNRHRSLSRLHREDAEHYANRGIQLLACARRVDGSARPLAELAEEFGVGRTELPDYRAGRKNPRVAGALCARGVAVCPCGSISCEGCAP